MNRLCIAALGGVLFACGACADKNSTGIEIINESALDRTGEMVVLSPEKHGSCATPKAARQHRSSQLTQC